MPVMEFETQINAPPDRVFAYVADLEKHTEWTHCEEIRKTSDGPVGVGTTYASRGKNFGMTTKEAVEVTEYAPNQRFSWRTSGAMGMKFNWSFELRPQDGGTLLIERLEPPKGVLPAIMGALVGNRAARKQVPEGLAKIKATLESAGS